MKDRHVPIQLSPKPDGGDRPIGITPLLYALFLLGLVVNAIYPAILLRMSSIRLQRELSAVTDVVRSTRHTMP